MKKILTFAAATILLAGCINYKNENDLSNEITSTNIDIGMGGVGVFTGINSTSIPGFYNSDSSEPATEVTTLYSSPNTLMSSQVAAGNCFYIASDSVDEPTLGPHPYESEAVTAAGAPFDSLLSGIRCDDVAPSGTYSATVNISFIAGGKNYSSIQSLSFTK